MPLPQYGSTQYNGFTFPSNIVTVFTETPVMSDDGRMVKYSKVEIQVKGYITHDLTIASGGSGAAAVAVLSGSSVSAITVTSGGSGYAGGVNVNIDPPNLGGGIQATAVATVTGGVVTGVTVTAAGNGYTSPPGVAFTAPVSAIATTDAYVENMRRVLSKPGRRLVYSNKGVGVSSLIVDPNGPISDCAYGPVPGALEIKPLGGAPLGNVAAFFSWSVTCHLPECTGAKYWGAGVFAQFAYSVDVSINASGYSVITTTGNFEIPSALNADGRSIATSADINWRDYTRLFGLAMPGYRRETKHTLSPDRRRVDFTLTDTQMPGEALPRNIVRANMQMRVANRKPSVVHDWTVTLSGDFTVNPLVSKPGAFLDIYDIITAKMDHARSTDVSPWSGAGDPRGQSTVKGKCVVLILNFDLINQIFSDDVSFTLTYRLAGASLGDIVAASGIWQPIGTDWLTWRNVMANYTHSPQSGGLTRWVLNPSNDTLVDLCPNSPAPSADPADDGFSDEWDESVAEEDEAEINAITAATEPAGLMTGAASGTATPGRVSVAGVSDSPQGPILLGPEAGGGLIGSIDPDTSWLGYECKIRYVEDGNIVRHKPLAGQPVYQAPRVDTLGPAGPVAADTTAAAPNVTVPVPDILQQVASPSAMVILEGAAMRLGFEIPVPQLVSYGGVTLGPAAYSEIEPNISSNVAGLPVRTLFWRRYYHLPTPPASLPLAANPYTGMDGGNQQ